MKKTKSPAYQWYPKDILGSERVALLTLIEEGAYRRALDYCWLQGSIPSDEIKLSVLIGKKCTPKIAGVIKQLFEPDPNNTERMIHDRHEVERAKQIQWIEKSAEGGKKSAVLRKKKGNGGTTVVDDCLENGINQTSTLQFASSSASAKNTEPVVVRDIWFEMFRRAAGPQINDDDLILEVGKFRNKYPNQVPNQAGSLINRWVATIGKQPVEEKQFVV